MQSRPEYSVNLTY